MEEINFCPFCDAPQHKVLNIESSKFFCKECNKFFNIGVLELKCPKCDSTKLADSDFPAPDGQVIVQCQKCKKMFSMKEFLDRNKE